VVSGTPSLGLTIIITAPDAGEETNVVLASMRNVLVSAGLVSILVPSAYSCTCDEQSEQPLCTRTPSELPTAIFVGTVTKLGRELAHNVEFSIKERLRGQVGSTFTLTSGNSSCDVDFAVGRSYLVLARYLSSDRSWGTSICLHTHLLTAEPGFVDPDLRTLRALRDHTPMKGWVYGWLYAPAQQTGFPL